MYHKFTIAQFLEALDAPRRRMLPTSPLHMEGAEISGTENPAIYVGHKLGTSGNDELFKTYRELIRHKSDRLAGMVTIPVAEFAEQVANLAQSAMGDNFGRWLGMESPTSIDEDEPETDDDHDSDEQMEDLGEDEEFIESLAPVVTVVDYINRHSIPRKYVHVLIDTTYTGDEGNDTTTIREIVIGVQLGGAGWEAFKNEFEGAVAEVKKIAPDLGEPSVFVEGNQVHGTVY